MKKIAVSLVFLLAVVGGIWGVLAQREQPTQSVQQQMTNNVGTIFAYQGRLNDDSQPADGPYDMEFRLFDALENGNQIGNVVTTADVTVTKGLFNVDLDFGENVFSGETRYLEMAVRPGSSAGSYETLAPRVVIRPVPYAQHADSAYTLATEMLPPTMMTATATTGGSLTAGSYFFKAVASDGVGTTVGSAETACVVDGFNTNRCALTWQAVTGAAAYRIYKGAASNEQDRYQTTTSPTYNYDTDNGATSGMPPATNTAFVNHLSPSGNSWLLGGNLGIGTTNPTVKLDVQGTIQFGTGNAEMLSSAGDNFGIRTASDSPNPSFFMGVGDGLGGSLHEPIVWNASTLVLNGSGRSWCPSCTPDPTLNHHLVINGSGNIGIGTTNPAERLTVDGNIKATGTICDGTGACVSLVAEQQAQIATLQSQMAALQEQQVQIDELQRQNEQLTAELATIRAQLATLEISPTHSSLSFDPFGFGFLILAGIGVAGWQKRGK